MSQGSSDESPAAPRIKSGSRATVHDVARVAGVSFKTVSRVVNGSTQVTPDTRQRVQAAMTELAYVRNAVAHSLVTGSSDTIGVVIDSIADRFFSSLVSVVEDRALAAGVSVLIASTGRSADREREQIARLLQQNVGALLVAPITGDHSYLERDGVNVPIVLVDRGWEVPGYDTIRIDDRRGARTATEHLIAHGHTRIAFLGESSALETVSARRAGYHDALLAGGLSADPTLLRSDCGDPGAADQVTRAMLAGGDPPTAIFASNPRAAQGVVSALHATRRLAVALVSFGDFELADSLVPAVTVIDHDPMLIAESAATRLLARMDGRKLASADITLPVKLIARGSGELRP